MTGFQQRTIDEKKNLDINIEKLTAFIMNSDTFREIPDNEQNNLKLQLDIMNSYSKILGIRIKNLI